MTYLDVKPSREPSDRFIRLSRNPTLANVMHRETPKEIAARLMAGRPAVPVFERIPQVPGARHINGVAS